MNEEMQTLTFEGVPMANKGGSVSITRMPLNKIKLGRNSRAGIDKTELDGLMESIKATIRHPALKISMSFRPRAENPGI